MTLYAQAFTEDAQKAQGKIAEMGRRAASVNAFEPRKPNPQQLSGWVGMRFNLRRDI
jgi:hypothetical protein